MALSFSLGWVERIGTLGSAFDRAEQVYAENEWDTRCCLPGDAEGR
jgi:hypothetical protein